MAITPFTLDDIIQELEREKQASQTDKSPSPVGLKYNPFPVAGIGDTDAKNIPPLEPAIADHIRGFLKAALESGKFTGMTVVGDFGMGKTHLLRWIEHVINSGTTKLRDQKVKAYYISNPGVRPMDILMAVTKAIGEENFRKMIWTIVAADLQQRMKEHGPKAIRSAFDVDAHQSLLGLTDEQVAAMMRNDALASFGKFRERYQAAFLPPRALRQYIGIVLRGVTPNLDVVQTLSSMLLDDEMKSFTSWIFLTSAEGRQQLKVPQADYFQAILEVIKRNGVGYIFLLVDEFEDITGTRFSPRHSAEYLATLRLLIDEHVSDFSLVVALVPRAWQITQELSPPLTDRLRSQIIDLQPLSLERAEEVVGRYLAQARGQDNGISVHDLRPFTREAIVAILGLTEGNIRAFVTACHRVLQHCWSSSEINGADVRSVLSA